MNWDMYIKIKIVDFLISISFLTPLLLIVTFLEVKEWIAKRNAKRKP
jgi:hypothetical protein